MSRITQLLDAENTELIFVASSKVYTSLVEFLDVYYGNYKLFQSIRIEIASNREIQQNLCMLYLGLYRPHKLPTKIYIKPHGIEVPIVSEYLTKLEENYQITSTVMSLKYLPLNHVEMNLYADIDPLIWVEFLQQWRIVSWLFQFLENLYTAYEPWIEFMLHRGTIDEINIFLLLTRALVIMVNTISREYIKPGKSELSQEELFQLLYDHLQSFRDIDTRSTIIPEALWVHCIRLFISQTRTICEKLDSLEKTNPRIYDPIGD